MDLVSLLATVILFATIGTLIAAVAAYAAYKLRERRKPVKSAARDTPAAGNEPMFLRPYVPPTPDTPDDERKS
jgi:hypothetical protein